MYLCYDIRGIQAFVFQIPRLRYIIGGSALIDRFDRETVPEFAKKNKWHLICTGGGKGSFACASASEADKIQEALIKEVHSFGADIRFGRDEDYSEAAHCADRLFPYLPENLEGHPCNESGLYPVQGLGVHDVVKERDWSHTLGRWFEERLLKANAIALVPGLQPNQLAFVRDVAPGTPGNCAMGGRNRWAVICMDGNDIGSQFLAMKGKLTGEALTNWVLEMSRALDACSMKACLAGIERVAREWSGTEDGGANIQDKQCCDETGALVLPLRPLVVGGDDIIVLCHASYAATFVREACRAFEDESRRLAAIEKEKGLPLWPATGDHITISAGILYCGSSLPLATAIPYAENLLAMAKGKGRKCRESEMGMPSPACVDFECVTEALLDHPRTRRERELSFVDEDLQGETVVLTCRPYRLDAFGGLLDELDNWQVPGSIIHQLLPALRAGAHDRRVFRWRLGKHQTALAEALAEDEDKPGVFPPNSRWTREKDVKGAWTRRTDLVDQALLFQESRRMTRKVTK